MKVVYLLYMNHIAFDTMYSVAGAIRSPFTVRLVNFAPRLAPWAASAFFLMQGFLFLATFFFPKLCPSRDIALLFPSDAVYSHNFEIPVVDD